jgi:hypothetical protein
VARTIANLASSESIRPNHLNEAINHRMLDRHLWTQAVDAHGFAIKTKRP